MGQTRDPHARRPGGDRPAEQAARPPRKETVRPRRELSQEERAHATAMAYLAISLLAVALLGALLWRTPLVSAKMRSSVTTAVRNLWLHKLRSFLSVLGIIIGTSAVIALMAFGEGSMQDALDAIRKQ